MLQQMQPFKFGPVVQGAANKQIFSAYRLKIVTTKRMGNIAYNCVELGKKTRLKELFQTNIYCVCFLHAKLGQQYWVHVFGAVSKYTATSQTQICWCDSQIIVKYMDFLKSLIQQTIFKMRKYRPILIYMGFELFNN